MGPSRVALASSVILAAAACGGSHADTVDPALNRDATVVVKTLSGAVKNADAVMPKCPVTAHVDAALTVSHMKGTLRYRWEHSDSTNGPERTIDVPSAAAAGTADLNLQSDDWPLNRPGVQLAVFSRVHVLAPIDRLMAPLSLEAKCY